MDTRAPVVATTSDGSLEIELAPTGDGVMAAIETPDGVLRGPDQQLTIREPLAAGVAS